MKKTRIFRNADIKAIYIGPPKGHKHLRLIIDTGDEVLVFQEATLAAVSRGYIVIKTHPSKEAIKLELKKLVERKEGYAEYQLIESDKSDEEVIREISKILEI